MLRSCFALLICCAGGSHAQATTESTTTMIHSIANDLDYTLNNNDKTPLLAQHVFVYTQGCQKDSFLEPQNKPLYGFVHRLLSPQAAQQVFPEQQQLDTTCHAACLERGTDQSIAHAVMPRKQYHEQEASSSLTDWFSGACHKVEVCLMNYHSTTSPLRIVWQRPKTQEQVDHIQVEYGEKKTKCFSSFIGHKFQALDSETSQVVHAFTVEYTTVLAIGTLFPTTTLEGDDAKRDFDQEIRNTLVHEWDRHNKVSRTFSPLGFAKGRLPDDVFASMRSFFHNNRGNKVLEEWGGRGVFVNWWDVPCSFIQIPWDLKLQWQLRLLELVQAWAGVPIEQTDMYGLRQYQSGARLLTHVDRITTHSVSLIVNVAQGNLTEPWPVEVHDHHDRLHEVPMQPGDVVYYESAKCLHGRNRPLKGKDSYYVNLFTHYRPVGDPEWYSKPNHEGTPAAVLDVAKDSCRLQPAGLAETVSGTLGTVQTMQCQDERLGNYRSPTLFQASSGKDLQHWWQQTANDIDILPLGGASSPVCSSETTTPAETLE